MKLVLFACLHNAGRSQMAEAFFNAAADPRKARAISGGTEPRPRIHTAVVEAMREVGIDIVRRHPVAVTPQVTMDADLLVTMGTNCERVCPLVPMLRRHTWDVEDPTGLPIERVRTIRDEVRDRVSELIRIRGWRDEQQRDARAAFPGSPPHR